MGNIGHWLMLSPVGLAAGLAALAVPLIIHLISRSRGRRVFVGSTRLIRSARKKSVYQVKLTQWILYVTRSLLMLVAALILGQLATRGSTSMDGNVAYVTPAWLAEAGSVERDTLESDVESVHVLAPGFPTIGDFIPASVEAKYDLWPLLAERLSVVSHRGTIHVYSSGRLSEFGELAPPLPSRVNWHTLPTVETEPVKLPLHVAVIGPNNSGSVSQVIVQALDTIRIHRLPELRWTVQTTDQFVRQNGYDAVIWAATSQPGISPRSRPPGQRWIDLNQVRWRGAWESAGFPQQLLNALLDENDWMRAWSSAPIPSSEAPNRTLDARHASQLPTRRAQHWLALALIMLWGIERWLSERRTRAPV